MSSWALYYAQYGSDELDRLLADGWEPFGVVGDHQFYPENAYIWLRRPIEKADEDSGD